jgi:hypothetical protein
MKLPVVRISGKTDSEFPNKKASSSKVIQCSRRKAIETIQLYKHKTIVYIHAGVIARCAMD